jgi:hypothetical protein
MKTGTYAIKVNASKLATMLMEMDGQVDGCVVATTRRIGTFGSKIVTLRISQPDGLDPKKTAKHTCVYRETSKP